MPPSMNCRLRVIVTGLADVGMREYSVAAVQPSVRSPDETVQRFVPVVDAPAVEQDLRRTVRHVVAVGVRNESQIRR